MSGPECVAASAGILGAVLNARLNIWGWWAWLIGNTVSAWVMARDGRWGFVVMFVIYDLLNVYGLINWSKGNDPQRKTGGIHGAVGASGDLRPGRAQDPDRDAGMVAD